MTQKCGAAEDEEQHEEWTNLSPVPMQLQLHSIWSVSDSHPPSLSLCDIYLIVDTGQEAEEFQ